MSLNASKMSSLRDFARECLYIGEELRGGEESNFLGAGGKKWAAHSPNIPRFRIPPSTQTNVYILPNLKAEILGRVVQSPIRLTQDKRKFLFEFCYFAIRFSVYCLAFCFEFE